MRTACTIFLILSYSFGEAQNVTTTYGLRSVHWKQNGVECDYKIVALSSFNVERFNEDSTIMTVIRGTGDSAIPERIWIRGYSNDSVSVRDGTCFFYDSSGSLAEIIEFKTGAMGSTITFANGDTIRYSHDFIGHIDSDYYDSYINNRVFKREFFKEGKFVNSFYPNDDLIMPNAELFSGLDLTKNSIDTIPIFLVARRNIQIGSVACNKHLRVLDEHYEPLKFPFALSSSGQTELKLINYQSTDSIIGMDTVVLYTIPEHKAYPVFLSTVASHINGRNVYRIHEITLRRKDKYLIVRNCGGGLYGHMVILDGDAEVATYDFEGNTTYNIPLTSLPKEQYQLAVRMCYDDGEGIGGIVNLFIKD